MQPSRLVFALALLASGLAPAPANAQAKPAPAGGAGDMGVALALSGDAARAESVFVSMLSHTRGDSRALNNLGNLRLLRGDLGVALAFYDRALKGDSTDAGIHLNRAITLMLMGDDARAHLAAGAGERLAGGINSALSLLGITPEVAGGSDEANQRAADQRPFVHRDEVRALLRSAAAAVPRDTTRAGGSGPGAATARHRPPTWRSAGARSSDQSDAANVLYWKR